MKIIIRWISLLIHQDSCYSSRSFSLIVSCVAGFLMALALDIALLIDVSLDGRIDSDMEGIAWVLVGISALLTSGNVGKIFKSKYQKKEKEEKDV